jgi:hypothetical protein
MTIEATDLSLSRRAFLRAAGGVLVTAAGLPILAACAPSAPSSPSGSGGGASSGAKVTLPTYVPLPTCQAVQMVCWHPAT